MILRLLETSTEDETNLVPEIKQKLRKYVEDHLEHFNRREWLNEIFTNYPQNLSAAEQPRRL